MTDGDLGDVDDYREPPRSLLGPNDFAEPGDNLFEGVFVVASRELWDAMNYATYMRECCSTCALEVNGEDGS